jgi:hypothetical protein
MATIGLEPARLPAPERVIRLAPRDCGLIARLRAVCWQSLRKTWRTA